MLQNKNRESTLGKNGLVPPNLMIESTVERSTLKSARSEILTISSRESFSSNPRRWYSVKNIKERHILKNLHIVISMLFLSALLLFGQLTDEFKVFCFSYVIWWSCVDELS